MRETIPDWALREDGSLGNTMVPKLEMAQEHLAKLASERYEKILTLEREKIELSGEVATLSARNKVLEAELAVRTQSVSFACETPTEYRGRNKGASAYLSGWEEGFRKHAFDNPYTAQHHRIAYTRGFNDGAAEAQKRIDAALREDR